MNVMKAIQNRFGMSHDEYEARMESYLVKTTTLVNLPNYTKISWRKRHVSFLLNEGYWRCILYHLVFTGYREKGFEIMKEAMNRGTQEEDRFSLSDYNIITKGQVFSLAKMDKMSKRLQMSFSKISRDNRMFQSKL